MPHNYIHSWSGLTKFETCPRQFEAKYVLKQKEPPSDQIKWGNVVHTAMEDRILGKETSPLPASMAPFQKILNGVEAAKRGGLRVTPEHELGITREGTPCNFWAKNVWLRSKADLTITATTTADLSDYKTGKWKSERGQMRLTTWLFLQNHPSISQVQTRYHWLQGGDQLRELHDRNNGAIQKIQADFIPRLQRVEDALASGHFDPKPSGLCKAWCSVLSCEFNGRNG